MIGTVWFGKAEPGAKINRYYSHLHSSNDNVIMSVKLPEEKIIDGVTTSINGIIAIHCKGGNFQSSRISTYGKAHIEVFELLEVSNEINHILVGKHLLDIPMRVPKKEIE